MAPIIIAINRFDYKMLSLYWYKDISTLHLYYNVSN